VAVFCLPDNLKEQYALRGDLEYAHSHCITLISSHYIHMDIPHLAGNLAAFLFFINIPAILFLRLLDLQTKAEKDELAKRTYIVHLVNLLLLPPIISECVLRYPFFAYSYGFSWIVNAYLGCLYALFLATRPVFLNLKAGTRYILLLSVLGISLCPTPWVEGSLVLLICVALLLLDVRKTKKQREELLITIVVVLIVYFLIEMGIPLRIIYESVNINIGAHYLGLLFGSLINAFIICLSIHKK
jgi:membrane associated rhomboid family serine protease